MKLYKYNINDFTQEAYQLAYNNLKPDRKTRVDKLRKIQDKKLTVAGDMLLKQALRDFGVDENILISKTPKGKPYIENSPIFFNISHSGDFCICVVSDKEIGVDIEKIRSVRLKLTERFATDNECKYIVGNEDIFDENYERFFEIWTLKEAYFKMLGTGIADNLKSVEFTVENGNVACNKDCSLILDKSLEGYIISIAEKI